VIDTILVADVIVNGVIEVITTNWFLELIAEVRWERLIEIDGCLFWWFLHFFNDLLE
jgi:hypothetical protein